MSSLPHTAEGARFELAIPCGISAFQADALGRYATPPLRAGVRFVSENFALLSAQNKIFRQIWNKRTHFYPVTLRGDHYATPPNFTAI